MGQARAGTHPVGRTELRSAQGEAQPEVLVRHGQERGEARVGVGSRPSRGPARPERSTYQTFSSSRARSAPVGQPVGDDIEHVQARPAVLPFGRGVDDRKERPRMAAILSVSL